MAAALDNLGKVYHRRGKFLEAEAVFRRALQIRDRLLGPVHADVRRSHNNVSVVICARRAAAEKAKKQQRRQAAKKKRESRMTA